MPAPQAHRPEGLPVPPPNAPSIEGHGVLARGGGAAVPSPSAFPPLAVLAAGHPMRFYSTPELRPRIGCSSAPALLIGGSSPCLPLGPSKVLPLESYPEPSVQPVVREVHFRRFRDARVA